MPGFGQAGEMERGICAGFKAKTEQPAQAHVLGHSILGVWAGGMSPKLPGSCNNSWETAKSHQLTASGCKWDLLSGMQQPECPCPCPEREGESLGGWKCNLCLQLPEPEPGGGRVESQPCPGDQGPQSCGLGSEQLLCRALRGRAGFWLGVLYPCKGKDGRAPKCARSLLLLLKSILMCCHAGRRLWPSLVLPQCCPWSTAHVHRQEHEQLGSFSSGAPL